MTGLDLEGIVGSIEKMGYVTVELKDKLKPSFYKLSDGTVVRVLISINHLTSHAESPHGHNINWSSTITCYVPKENRHPEKYTQFDPTSVQSNILDDDMQYETLIENFNNYSMNNGMTVGVKPAVAQVGKTRFYTEDGEPVYGINVTPVFKVTKGG